MERKSSRVRYAEYEQSIRARNAARKQPQDHSAVKRQKPRHVRSRSVTELFFCFLKLLRPQTGRVVFALVTLTIATVLLLIPPAATKLVIDNILGNQPLPDGWFISLPSDPLSALFMVGIGVVVIVVARIAIEVWGRWQAMLAAKRLELGIRKQVFQKAIRLPMYRVYELKSGGAASILRADVFAVGELVNSMLYNPWRAIIQVTGSIAILAWVNWMLAAGALLVVPWLYFSISMWVARIRPRMKDIRQRREKIDAMATEAFGGIRVIRSFAREDRETIRFISFSHLMARQQLKAWWMRTGMVLMWETILPLGLVGLLTVGGWQVVSQKLTVGDLTMFLVYSLVLLGPVTVLIRTAATLQDGLSGLDRILDLLEEPKELSNSTNAIRLQTDQVQGHIAIDNISFRYPGAKDFALRDISLTVEAGETIALIGPSGAGKTTLCNLVARFYDPTQGRILLDHDDLRELDVASFRNLLGIVEQDIFLFDGSIRENIEYGAARATDAEIQKAAEMAGADVFISELPGGFETQVGERGVKLSGGQRQRIAIARAVLKDPKILILDEATSQIDLESEQVIQRVLVDYVRNRTTIIITHRLAILDLADRILVMDAGRIVDAGTHDELIQRCHLYQRLYQLDFRASA